MDCQTCPSFVSGSQHSCWAWWKDERWCFRSLGFPPASAPLLFESRWKNICRIQRMKGKTLLPVGVLMYCLGASWEVSSGVLECTKKENKLQRQKWLNVHQLTYAGMFGWEFSADFEAWRKAGRGGSSGREDITVLFFSEARVSSSFMIWPGNSCSLLGISFCRGT